ncbi:MAG: radical SAM protein [Planctomycetota bacterium]
MTTETQPTLVSFADWLRATDPRASRWLPLLERAARLLAGEEVVWPQERLELAAELEGWRYQSLDERSATPTPEDRGLANALDLAANELAGRDPRPPRDPRRAIHDASLDAGPIAEAKAVLDPEVDLEGVTRQASRLTLERFGAPGSSDGPASARRRMLLYAPLYLSSHCTNHCTYCGFRDPHPIERRHLTPEQALHEAEILRSRGFRHVLLVAGDFPRLTTPEYFAEIIVALKARGIDPAIEIAPQSTGAYAKLATAGACGVTLYQETYHEELYGLYHPRGTKSRFDWRLEGIERAAEAGVGRLGLGVLLGLADPQEDLVAMMRHAIYLERRFPDRRLAFSLPRIYEAPQGFEAAYAVDDETFLRLYCALRIAFPEAELVLSTREPAALRNRLAQICITQMSAGSRTVPGGYEDASGDPPRGQQFPISDHRTPAQVAAWLEGAGFDPLWEIP